MTDATEANRPSSRHQITSRKSAKKLIESGVKHWHELVGDTVEEVQPEEDLAILHVHCTLVSASDLLAGDSTGTSDPYVKASVKEVDGKIVSGSKFRSATVKQTLDPTWQNQNWNFQLAPGQHAHLQVMDEDTMGADELLGSANIEYATLSKLNNKDPSSITLPLKKAIGKDIKGSLTVTVKVRATMVAQSFFKEDALLNNIAEELGKDVKTMEVSFRELRTVMEKHHMQVNPEELRKEFNTCDANKSDSLSYLELQELFKRLRIRSKIKEIFLRITGENACLSAKEFAEWLTKEQQETTSTEDAAKLIKQFEPKETSPNDPRLFATGFQNFMLSVNNELLAPIHDTAQDLDKPISQYFVNSSHNTYLLRAQIGGNSNCSVDAYASALKRGCRCVELDCWDSGNKVVITHGGAFTGSIKFKAAISIINEYAFTVSSCPVILSLEVHCKKPGKDLMATIMKKIFGDKIATLEDVKKVNGNVAALQNKILIKASAKDDSLLAGLVGIPAHKFDPPDESKKHWDYHAETGKHWLISSLEELHAKSYCDDETEQFVTFNNRQLSRIYPKGSRVDSSNYDPVPYWAAGCQVVALNYQTAAEQMWVNEGMFNQNGGCGYVLKPKVMLQSGKKWVKYFEKTWIYKVSVIDGWRPVAKKGVVEVKKTLPSLSVKVAVYTPAGVTSYSTAVVKNNGLNPIWDQDFSFEVQAPEVSCVLFVVNNENSSDQFVGYYSLPFGAARLGYRRIPLKNAKGIGIPDASLFIHMSRKLKPDPNRKVIQLEKQVKALTAQNEALLKRLDAMEKRLATVEGEKKDSYT